MVKIVLIGRGALKKSRWGSNDSLRALGGGRSTPGLPKDPQMPKTIRVLKINCQTRLVKIPDIARYPVSMKGDFCSFFKIFQVDEPNHKYVTLI